MPYKSKNEASKASKERMKRYRAKRQGVTAGRNKTEGVTTKGVTLSKESVTPKEIAETVGLAPDKAGKYAPIIYTLADTVKREKLRKVCEQLSGKPTHRRNYLSSVWYGIGDRPVTMETVSKLLEAVH